MDNLEQWLLLLIPIAVLQVGLMLLALVDLLRRERTKGPKWAWALAILFVNFIGPVLYLLFGREE
ncbi:MAG: PLDc_N domain-containing protein [Anaerolineae bacterium]|nr:PLDc_N domain-containing protein [Anaerolineae bacterium]